MSGSHDHPEYPEVALVVQALAEADTRLAWLSDRVSRLTAQVVALEAAAAVPDAPQDVYDYWYSGKPPAPQLIGRAWTRLDLGGFDPVAAGWESTLVYLNITPRFSAGKDAGAIRPRLVRADGDMSAYDDILLHVDALDGDGISCRNRLYWEAGDGNPTYIELRCIGGLSSAVLGTRYRKDAVVKDRG